MTTTAALCKREKSCIFLPEVFAEAAGVFLRFFLFEWANAATTQPPACLPFVPLPSENSEREREKDAVVPPSRCVAGRARVQRFRNSRTRKGRRRRKKKKQKKMISEKEKGERGQALKEKVFKQDMVTVKLKQKKKYQKRLTVGNLSAPLNSSIPRCTGIRRRSRRGRRKTC